jgi:general secretion pathway protein A
MYETFFGFEETPFSLTPNPEFFFLSPSHYEAYESLWFALQRREGFIVLTGEVGLGKTTLYRTLLRRLQESGRDFAVILNPRLDPNELLEALLDDFGIGHPAGLRKKELLDYLNAFLLAKGNAIVVVDEAQLLDDEVFEELRLLSNLETDATKLLQIVLVGQPELERRLEQSNLRQLTQRVTCRYRLAPLDEANTAEYIRHRLTRANPRHPVRFEPTAARAVFSFAGGVPRLINVICDRALLAAFTANATTVTPEHVEAARQSVQGTDQVGRRPDGRTWRPARWIAVALVLVLIGIAGWWCSAGDFSAVWPSKENALSSPVPPESAP